MSMNSRAHTVAYHIKVNGADLPQDQIRRVTEVTVEQNLHLPDMCVLRIVDTGDDTQVNKTSFLKILDQQSLPIGGAVEISLGQAEQPETVFKGEITAIELDVSQAGRPPVVVVRGYARSHRLHRGRQSKSYQNMSDSDIVTKIGQQVGLQVKADSTSPVHDYVLQNNLTHWEFLRERASRLGYEMFVDDKTLNFRKPQKGQSAGPVQRLWDNLLGLRVKLSSSFQASEVVVRSWDPMSKEAIIGTASNGRLAPDLSMGKTGSAVASSFGAAKVYVVNRPVVSQDEATALAQAVYDNLDGSFVYAEGTCLGDPTLRPGLTIPMDQLGTQLSGKYYLTAVTHSVTGPDGYHSTFVVSGRQNNSVLELVEGREGASLPTVVVGIVTDNTDPDGHLGRVKVKFPWLVDDDQSWWARVVSPMAGADRGFYFLPEVDDEVLVAFEHGDVTRPYILGALWNGKDAPPKPNSGVISDGKVNERLIKTRAGHVISLVDKDGSEAISIIDKTGKNKITIESSSNKISIAADGDISIEAKGKVDIKAQKDVTVDTQANATVKAQQNVDVEAQGNATVKATGNATVQANGNGSIQATGTLDLKGASVNVEAQGTMSIKASGPLTVQGATVSIN